MSRKNRSTSSSPLKNSAEFVGDMGRLFVDDVKTTYRETASRSTRNKALASINGAVVAAYTVGDDVLAGSAYAAIKETAGTAPAVAGVGVVSTGVAAGLAFIQEKRKRSATRERGDEPVESNGSLMRDMVSTYGIGVPATVLAYERGTVPTRTRLLGLAAFYGWVGQAGSYVAFETLGKNVGLNPNIALATGIVAAASARYGFAVRDGRKSADTATSENTSAQPSKEVTV